MILTKYWIILFLLVSCFAKSSESKYLHTISTGANKFIDKGFLGGNCYLGYMGMPNEKVFSIKSSRFRESANVYLPITIKRIKTSCMQIDIVEINPLYLKFYVTLGDGVARDHIEEISE
jgi:hypothetical protein